MSQGYWPGCTVGPAASCMTEYEWAFKVMQGGKLFYLFYLNGTHTHICVNAFIHKKYIRIQWRSCMWIRTRMRGNSTDTFLLEHDITSHVLYIYRSVQRDVYATVDKQAEKWNGDHPTEYIAMLLTSVFGRPMINFTCQNEYPENSPLKCFAGKLNQSHVQIWTC